MEITKGNFNKVVDENPDRNNWILGTFMEKGSMFNSDAFEVKWAKHKKGYTKTGLKTDIETKTVTIIINGKFQINFTGKDNIQTETVVLERLGDYVAYDASKMNHTAEALEDSLLIVFRWPSKR